MQPSFQVLGVRVDAVQMSDAVARLRSWIDDRQRVPRFVAVTGMHGIAESQQNSNFREALTAADLIVPDGMPLVWLGRLKGHPEVAEQLARVLQKKHGIVVAGTYTPPFRPLTEAEGKELAAVLEKTSPDVLWVGLSTPKQENWMYEHRHRLNIPVMLGVGAAFDMNSGNLRRAPKWMQKFGLEWFFRLAFEPRRLWKRYLVTIPKAVWLVCLELLHFSSPRSGPGQGVVSAAANSTGESSIP